MGKALSFAQSASCEHARTPRCRCRCGGKLHGAARVSDVLSLPREDPHAVSARAHREELRRRRREERAS